MLPEIARAPSRITIRVLQFSRIRLMQSSFRHGSRTCAGSEDHSGYPRDAIGKTYIQDHTRRRRTLAPAWIACGAAEFRIGERLHLNFRSEFFDIHNHPNFGRLTNGLTSSFLGYSTQTLASSLAGSDNAAILSRYGSKFHRKHTEKTRLRFRASLERAQKIHQRWILPPVLASRWRGAERV